MQSKWRHGISGGDENPPFHSAFQILFAVLPTGLCHLSIALQTSQVSILQLHKKSCLRDVSGHIIVCVRFLGCISPRCKQCGTYFLVPTSSLLHQTNKTITACAYFNVSCQSNIHTLHTLKEAPERYTEKMYLTQHVSD
jgi:hypothetical protein